jgi:lysophospholipase L1-like esterase
MPRGGAGLGLVIFFAALQLHAESTIATVGDSLADAIYLGLKLQPSLLRDNGLRVERWSRPKIGLTRVDYFDYTSWLRETDTLGSADFCVVELGANDLQSIDTTPTEPGGRKKWIRLGSDDWRRAYSSRVLALVNTLKSRRCGQIVWLLQPPYENKFLSQYHEMMNAVQLAGLPDGAAAFEIAANSHDYSPDGVHPNKEFCFRLGRAVATLVVSWRQPLAGSNCVSCHAPPLLVPSRLPDLGPLVFRRAD